MFCIPLNLLSWKTSCVVTRNCYHDMYCQTGYPFWVGVAIAAALDKYPFYLTWKSRWKFEINIWMMDDGLTDWIGSEWCPIQPVTRPITRLVMHLFIFYLQLVYFLFLTFKFDSFFRQLYYQFYIFVKTNVMNMRFICSLCLKYLF